MADTVVETHEPSTAAHHAESGLQRLMQFLHDTRQEMHKVVTPNRTEVQSTTVVVIVSVFLFAAFFELVDLTLGRGLDKILLALTHH